MDFSEYKAFWQHQNTNWLYYNIWQHNRFLRLLRRWLLNSDPNNFRDQIYFYTCGGELLSQYEWMLTEHPQLLKAWREMFTKTLDSQSAHAQHLRCLLAVLLNCWLDGCLQTQLPILVVGVLSTQEEPNQRPSAKKIHLLSPTAFYRKFALDYSGEQVAVDLSLLSGQYSNLASLDCISQYSAGKIYYYPSYHQDNPIPVQKLPKDL